MICANLLHLRETPHDMRQLISSIIIIVFFSFSAIVVCGLDYYFWMLLVILAYMSHCLNKLWIIITISPCWMKWKSCVDIGCSLCSVFYLKPQGCIFMLALWKCHLCFSSSVWLMHFLLPDVTLTCISHSTVSKLNKGHLNPFPSLWKVVDNNLNTPVL